MGDRTVPPHFADLSRTGHDIRGPVGVVVGALDELERDLGDAAAQHAAMLGIARRGARRLLRLADRYTVAAELARGTKADLAPANLVSVARRAVEDAFLVHGRKDIELELSGALAAKGKSIDARVHGRWATVAIGEALMLATRAANTKVFVRCDAAPDGAARLSMSGDGDASALTAAWSAARASAAGSLDEGELASRIILGVMAAHGGDARLDVLDLMAGAPPRIVLGWPTVTS